MAEVGSKKWGANGLEFERSIIELEHQIDALKRFSSGENIDIAAQIESLEKRLDEERRRVFSGLTAWQRVQLARHPARPHTLDYIKLIAEEFVELYGDRCFGDDKAVVQALGRSQLKIEGNLDHFFWFGDVLKEMMGA